MQKVIVITADFASALMVADVVIVGLGQWYVNDAQNQYPDSQSSRTSLVCRPARRHVFASTPGESHPCGAWLAQHNSQPPNSCPIKPLWTSLMIWSSFVTITHNVEWTISPGLDILCEIDKLSCLSYAETASNMDVEGWCDHVAHTTNGIRHRPYHGLGWLVSPDSFDDCSRFEGGRRSCRRITRPGPRSDRAGYAAPRRQTV